MGRKRSTVWVRTIGRSAWLLAALALPALVGVVQAGGNECGPGEFPDVIVGDLIGLLKYGTVGDITAFAVGTTSCNVGTCWLNWQQGPSNQHPVIGQSMYRLKDGRFEQIGQSWLKHGFFALSLDLCYDDCQATNGDHLGVHCSDPYSASLNGYQPGLGPKFEVNVSTGEHPHPVTGDGISGNAIFKRLQVHNDDLNPLLNPGADYFVEGHYVAEDDAGAGKQNNNASYRPIVVTGSDGNYNIQFSAPTEREKAAIHAWSAADPFVRKDFIDVPGDGRFILASRVTDLGNGLWHYEYAVQNLSSHRSAMSFSVPLPLGAPLTNIGFHDVDYHSGEPFEGTDWQHNNGADGFLTWTTGENEARNPNANALRWGTLYNFRFDTSIPPESGDVSLGLYRSGIPASLTGSSFLPKTCNNDDVCDPGEGCGFCLDCLDGICGESEGVCSCPEDCGEPPEVELDCGNGLDDDCDGFTDCVDSDCCDAAECQIDLDGDGVIECIDCDDGLGGVWATPAEVENVLLHPASMMTWTPPAEPGALAVTYEALRTGAADDFQDGAACLQSGTPTDPFLVDAFLPFPGEMFAYLVRAVNACPLGTGPLGTGEGGQAREGRFCN